MLTFYQVNYTIYNNFKKLQDCFKNNPEQRGEKSAEFSLNKSPVGTASEIRDIFNIDSFMVELIDKNTVLIYFINNNFHIKLFNFRNYKGN